MDPLSFGFLGLVVCLGGLVAYIADGLGRKIGKKRLSPFGLRPRHTATLLTILSGVLIPLLTVGIIALASRDFRQWVTEGRAAIQQVSELRGQVLQINRDIARKTNLVSDLERRYRDSMSQIEASQKLLEANKRKLTQAKSETASAQARSAQLNQRVREQSGRLREVSLTLTSMKVSLTSIKHASAELQRAYALQQGDLKDSYDQNKKLNDDNELLVKNGDKLRIELLRLEGEQTRLNQSIELSKAQLDVAQREITRILREVDEKNSLLAQVKGQLSEATSKLDVNVFNSRYQPLIFRGGEELARVTLPGGLLPIEATAAIKKLILSASYAADLRGASPGPNGGLSTILPDRAQEDGRVIGADEQIQIIAQAIGGVQEEVVLIATSIVNSFQGETVGLMIRPFRNPILYAQGDTIVETRIDGSLAEATIFQRVSAFLEGEVREAAIKKGMIPIIGRDNGLGAVSSDQMFQLVTQISGVGRTVRVIAIAAVETRAASPLKLDFKLR